MIFALLALAVLNLLLLVLLFVKKPAPPEVDSRLSQLPENVAGVRAAVETLDAGLRASLAELRRDQSDAARHAREEAAVTFGHLRNDSTAANEALRGLLQKELSTIQERLQSFMTDAREQQLRAQEILHKRLQDLGMLQTQNMEKMNRDNAAKLEEMRQTVDEKLHATLQTRLTESFGQVTTHLGEVQKGLGEMKELATGVSDLKKVFSNVKSRGIVGEFQLGMQLEQMFSPEQYEKNVRIKRGTTETVEYALKFPSADGSVLLPIDAKFPREDWERLEHAYEHGSPEEIAKAGAAFERTIRNEGKRISDKYIEEPKTLPHAIMFLPTEALYAEVVRRPGLQSQVQQECRVTIAGPSTFMAILTSFQMGFHTIALEKKGNEVWKVLANVKTEFGKFEQLMTKVEDNVGKVQKSLNDIGVRTRAINRNLRNVTELSSVDAPSPVSALEEIAGVAPLLAASEED